MYSGLQRRNPVFLYPTNLCYNQRAMGNGLKLILSIIICQAAGILGSFFTAPAIGEWYADLKKPSFNPPNWIFAPVWTILYALMGVTLFLVWRKGLTTKGAQTAIFLFAVQLVLNILWSFLFFGLKSPLYGFLEIIVLWVAILLTIISFLKISQPAGVLLIPYLAWVTFAALLNFSLLRLN